jgi:5-methyltetrahydropteroyltriglutamate--homocysteine methyltransferase
MSRIRASIVGSLPKPAWLAEPEKLRGAWRLPPDLLVEGTDDAVKLWADEQERASLDVITDGEQRRRHYIWGFIESLMKVDFDQLGLRKSRGQRYVQQTQAPRVLGQMHWSGPVLTEGLRFLKSRTNRPVKITLPGPMTVADSVIDEFGGRSDADFAMAYAKLLNKEVRALSEAGADVIQIDEPCFNIYLEAVDEWGIEALETAFAGVTAKRAVHICYGYGVPQVLAWKSANMDWNQYHHTLPLLAKSSIDQVSVECAASGINLEVLELLKGKEVMVGVIDVGTEDIETPDVVAKRIEAALRFVPPEHMIACTDCGLVPRSRHAAVGKMHALARGAALVNGASGKG